MKVVLGSREIPSDIRPIQRVEEVLKDAIMGSKSSDMAKDLKKILNSLDEIKKKYF